MNRMRIALYAAMIGSAVTAFAYEPLGVAFFRLSEPYFACPVKCAVRDMVLRADSHGDGTFGAKRRNGRTHTGIDIQAPVGAAVYASKSGLAFRGNVPTGYGKYVMIYHPDGFITMYSHLSGWVAESGEKVRRGDLIGFVGKTGNAAALTMQPHLHFEIKKGQAAYDPIKMMR
jgi:murein DD-endopeptidase MepM/ murein hydrolase activator NlpD